jgi:hypothetical protein
MRDLGSSRLPVVITAAGKADVGGDARCQVAIHGVRRSSAPERMSTTEQTHTRSTTCAQSSRGLPWANDAGRAGFNPDGCSACPAGAPPIPCRRLCSSSIPRVTPRLLETPAYASQAETQRPVGRLLRRAAPCRRERRRPRHCWPAQRRGRDSNPRWTVRPTTVSRLSRWTRNSSRRAESGARGEVVGEESVVISVAPLTSASDRIPARTARPGPGGSGPGPTSR